MKRKLGGAIVKKCIVTAMSVMLLGNSVLTVRAEETTPVQLETQQEIQQDEETQPDQEEVQNKEVHNEVVQNQQEDSQAVQSETESAVEETVQTAVEEAESAAKEASRIVEDTKQELDKIQGEVDENRETFAQEAENVQTEADQVEQEVGKSLITVTNPDGEERYEVIVGEKTQEDGSISSVTMQDYVDTQTQIAENAKAELEKALDINADEAQIAEYAEAVKEAAKDVYNAAYLAEQAFAMAEDTLKEEIRKYNACARAYGYELLSYNGEILEYTQEEQEQFNAKAGLTSDTEEIRQELGEIAETDLEEQKERIEQAQQTVEEAKDTYESAQQAAEDIQQSVESAQNALQAVSQTDNQQEDENAAMQSTPQTMIEEAEDKIEQAQQKYEAARNELDDVIMSVKDTVPNLSSLRMELTKKMAAMNHARQDLYQVREQKKAAVSYVAWADQLVKASEGNVVTGVYGQLVGTKEENAEFSYGNDKQFDKGDDNVVTRDQIHFAPISESADIVVPYDIFKAYVKESYDRKSKDGSLILYGEVDKRIGLGISSTDDGTMKKIFWKYDTETKKIIPESMFIMLSEDDELPDWMTQEGSVYFAGYTFKQENDGYHIDGHLCKASAPGTPDTPDIPGGDTPGGTSGDDGTSDTPGSTSGDGSTTNNNITVIQNIETPLSDGSMIIPDEEIPLSDIMEPDMVLLDEEEVPLSDTVPKTGDTAEAGYPFLIAGIGALVAAVISRKREK